METVLRLHFVKQCIFLNLVVIQYSPYRSPPVSSSRLNSGSMWVPTEGKALLFEVAYIRRLEWNAECCTLPSRCEPNPDGQEQCQRNDITLFKVVVVLFIEMRVMW